VALVIERLGERVYWAPGGTNIGLVLTDSGVLLIDSGLNDTPARRVLRDVQQLGRSVIGIVTTHGHADHFGGNAFIVRRTGARVWAPAMDEAVLRYPLLHPIALYAGADPPEALRGGFLLAEPSPVDEVYGPGSVEIDGVALTVVSLRGHSINQMGILVDGVFFCADLVLPERVIERYRLPYLHSVSQHLASLDRAETVDHHVAVPGHGSRLEHVSTAVAMNRALVLEIGERVVELCADWSMPEEILARLLGDLGSPVVDPAGYYLVHPVVYAYLSWLERIGQVQHEVREGRSLWRASR
jgi:glyoxylase-like metal-dependent hydrolase (beta-lactamase superfamily II)